MMLLPIRVPALLRPRTAGALDEAADHCSRRSARVSNLTNVGLGYLNRPAIADHVGGEVQRINLTALAHPRSPVRSWRALHRTAPARCRAHRQCHAPPARRRQYLVVVEHDPKVMQAADACSTSDRDPASTAAIVFFGPISQLACGQGSLTADFVWRRRETPRTTTPVLPDAGVLRLQPRRRTQSQKHRCRDSARASGVRHRRQRFRQIHSGARHPVPGAAARQGQAHRKSRPPPRPQRRRAARGCRHGRPEPHRPHDALESRELCGRLRRDSRFVRAAAAGART